MSSFPSQAVIVTELIGKGALNYEVPRWRQQTMINGCMRAGSQQQLETKAAKRSGQACRTGTALHSRQQNYPYQMKGRPAVCDTAECSSDQQAD